MKILVLSFCYEPDLTAGSFKNSALVKKLVQLGGENLQIDVITTLPNKFRSYDVEAKPFEEQEKLRIWRIEVPAHETGFMDRIWSYKSYYFGAQKIIRENNLDYDLVYASTSRLFTGYLGARIANKKKTHFYLDVRDIFADTIKDVIDNPVIKIIAMPIIKMVEKYTLSSADHLNIVSGGFKSYFEKYSVPEMSVFTNGIDEEFLNYSFDKKPNNKNGRKIITYAGNIGEGQGLEKIIPQAAKELEDHFQFRLIGGGGTKHKIIEKSDDLGVTNIEFIDPVGRDVLLDYYRQTDYLFLHLNNYQAFEKVLPSKVFEYAATGKPIIAGVSGYSKKFISEEIDNAILFNQCDHVDLINQLNQHTFKVSDRSGFISKFNRGHVITEMAHSVIHLAKSTIETE